MRKMASPRPTAAQLGFIVLGALIGAGISYGLLRIGGALGGAIIGVCAAIGAIPYTMAVQAQKKADGDG